MKRYILIIFLLMLALGSYTAPEAQAQFFMFQNPLIDEPAPDFKAQTLKGGERTLSDFRNDKSAIVFFWATWCPHCRTQLNELNKQSRELAEKGIKVVLVDLGEASKQVDSYMKKNKIDFDVFLDKDQSIAEEYGIVGVPTFFFVNKNGIVKAVEHQIPSNYEQILNN